MRSFISMLAILLFTSTALSAQTISEDKVPIGVQKTLFIKFPQAKDKVWELAANDTYRVSFNNDNAMSSAVFNKEGKWLETASKVEIPSLPDPVTRAVAAHFTDYTIKSVDELDTFYDGILYQIIITKQNVYKEVKIKPTGQIISKSLDKALTN